MPIEILALLLAAAAPSPTGEQPSAAAPSVAANSPQAAFDAAMVAYDAARFEEAARAFALLEARPAVRRSPQVHATILLRMGVALTELDKPDEAEAALRKGLSLLPPSDTEMARLDRHIAFYSLGRIDRDRLNYLAAAANYQTAIDQADNPLLKARTLLSLAGVLMFDDSDAAQRSADEAYRIVEATLKPGKDAKKQIADVQTVRARIMLNQGRATEAYELLRSAVADQGGLDLKVNYQEIVTRADLALAALLANKPDDARRYLAYTGAGRMEKSPFDLAVGMETPPCGGPFNLRPDDTVVVEFYISDEGVVRNPTPIYASIKGPAVLEFARAVADWSWRPSEMAKVPPLFRITTRVELRCSTGVTRPPVEQMFTAELDDWLKAESATMPVMAASAAADVAPVRAELARRRPTGGKPLIPALLRLATNPIVPRNEQLALLAEARDLAARLHAPAPVIAYVEIAILHVATLTSKNSVDGYRAGLRALAARPEMSDDAIVSNTLRVMIADPLYRTHAPTDAQALLQQVIKDERLPEKHALKVGALIRLAALQAEAGDRHAAALSFGRTGLSEQQCALLDAKPALLRDNAGSSSFPMEAMRWGFEGWVRIEYDISGDGRTSAQRAIIAYPPFIFRQAAVGIAKGLVYTKSFRPDGSAGCGGQQENVRFQINR
ncbi:MAG: hypothetical protein ACOY5R_03950 [Pseudomonadota bacterium]